MNRNLLIVGGIGLVAVVVLVGFVLTREKSEVTVEPTPTPKTEIELLVQDALNVTLKSGNRPLYVLTIDKIPNGASSISYEITYDTTNKGTQGIVGSPVTLKEGQGKYVNDKLVFGSESRGKYALDQGVNNIQISIRLTYKDGSEKGWKGTLELP